MPHMMKSSDAIVSLARYNSSSSFVVSYLLVRDGRDEPGTRGWVGWCLRIRTAVPYILCSCCRWSLSQWLHDRRIPAIPALARLARAPPWSMRARAVVLVDEHPPSRDALMAVRAGCASSHVNVPVPWRRRPDHAKARVGYSFCVWRARHTKSKKVPTPHHFLHYCVHDL